MNNPPIHLTRDDHTKLRQLLTAALNSGATPSLERLRSELDRAAIMDSAAMPADVVTMGANVQFKDLGTGELEEFTLAFPENADVGEGRLSVLAPIGTALIGFREGDTVDWPTPGGMRRLKIQRVTQDHNGTTAVT